MSIASLVADLSRPEAYDHQVAVIDVIQTHASVVFLAGDQVYKVKKPRDLGFLDYSTLKRRAEHCHAEAELNRRLAADVYLGVVPLTMSNGRLRIGGSDAAVEYAVHMRRLPESSTLRSRWNRGDLSFAMVREVARTIADFHRHRMPDRAAATWSSSAEVQRNHRENFAALRDHLGEAITASVYTRLERRASELLRTCAPMIGARAHNGIACDGHGDLRTDHVYIHDHAPVGRRIDIVDCIEFNARYRCGDPIADIAFLAVDLSAIGARVLADALTETYVEASGDTHGSDLLPLYRGYRATIRAKVEAIRSKLAEFSDTEKARARARARAWSLVALGELEPAEQRPGLVLIAGLPGSGKSTVAAGLAQRCGFRWIRADTVRKGLAGLGATTPAAATLDAGIYASAWSDRTYDACLRQARETFDEGGRAVVDATFVTQARRQPFLDLAVEMGVPCAVLVCTANESVTRQRLIARRSDASDAGFEVYRDLRARWEPLPEPRRYVHGEVRTDDSDHTATAQVDVILAAAGLSPGSSSICVQR
ncbi:MAG: AAA family ATPase [Nannocystaceae bacterium]